jgi:hypothetical protein
MQTLELVEGKICRCCWNRCLGSLKSNQVGKHLCNMHVLVENRLTNMLNM